MDKSGAGSFIYAKASGIIGKSFVGPRAQYLFEQKSLSDLWTLLFQVLSLNAYISTNNLTIKPIR